MKKDKSVFLDTTFLLPFFQVLVRVEKFHLDEFKQFILSLSRVHLSELSVYEAKAKIFRLNRNDKSYSEALRIFGNNLHVLRNDSRIIFHPYSTKVDVGINSLIDINPELDIFDAVIVSQAADAEILVTEDDDLINLSHNSKFEKSPIFSKLEIKRWKDVSEYL